MSPEQQRSEGGSDGRRQSPSSQPSPGYEATQAWSPGEGATGRPPGGPPPQGHGPGAPQQPGGYGPGGPQNPWGPPQGPWGGPPQAPYGPGPQAPYGPGAQGPGGPPAKKRGAGRPIGIVLAVVVLVVIAVAGYAVFNRSSDDGGGTTASGGPLKGKVLWQSFDAPQNTLGSSFVGAWHTTDLSVTVAPEGLVAYDARTGQRRWQLASPPLPGGGGQSLICGLSTATGGNVGVIGFGAGSGGTVTRCEAFALIDLATGRARAQGTLQSGTTSGNNTLSAEIIGSTAVIEYGGGLTGFDLSGHQRWRLDPKAAGSDDCFVNDLLPGANTAMVLFDCLGSRDTVTVAQVSPDNGTVTKKAPVTVPSGIENATFRLLSTQPVVLNGGSSDNGAFISLDDAFRVKATIPQKGAWGSLNMNSYSGLASHMLIHAAVSADTLVVGTEQTAVNSLRDTNKLVAFDLATGRQRWATSLGPKVTGVPVAFAGGAVIAMSDGTYENPPQVFRLGGADGKATAMGPAYSRDLIARPRVSRLYWDGSHLFGISLTIVPSQHTPSVYALG
ncbi:PQQ-binding-like beta-propeller repeat protein [Actinoallomurus iriomotensis]|nr:PQQ-binding-like beta-propeller repeat protein [Actinoallomurus iriomotensis]